ncbi:MAG: DUF433 domain-containing protein [Firmicutes bacterium]|nr:DUF433 domain-containing protein [Bacillota bacterium]
MATEVLTRPLYSFAEVDRLAGVASGTARRWRTGYAFGSRDGPRIGMPPVTPRPAAGQAGASFLDLVEVVAIGRFKQLGFSLRAIRFMVETCQQVLGVERPLTSLRFKQSGSRVFVDHADRLVEVGPKRAQLAWKALLEPFLEDLDYRADRVATWWPEHRRGGVRIDPQWGFGRPVVGARGIRTDILREQWEAGVSMAEIARDYVLDLAEVEAALRFELRRSA